METTQQGTTPLNSLSILVVTYNSADVIGACLRSVLDTAPSTDVEVIVVDNDSSDGTPQLIRASFPQVNLVESRRNLGFASGNNEAAQRASGQLLLLLNPDTVVQPGAFSAMMAAFADPAVGVAGALLTDAEHRPAMSYGAFPTLSWALAQTAPLGRLGVRSGLQVGVAPQGEESHDVDYVSGACLMVRHGVWEGLGGLDDSFFAYFEETDFCLRAGRAGWRVRFMADAEVQHLEGASFAGRSVERTVRYYEGLLHFFSKNMGVGRTLVLRAWMLLVNCGLIGVSTLLPRRLKGVRANRPIQMRLVRLAFKRFPRCGEVHR